MNKVYVACRRDLEAVKGKSYPLVQGGHALAALILSNKLVSWNNDYLIYIEVKDLDDLKHLMHKLDHKSIKYASFIEPDKDYEITSIAVEGEWNILSKYPLYIID